MNRKPDLGSSAGKDGTGGKGSGGDTLRLQLFLARAGLASRRKAEEFITAGRVKVNGAVITELGARCSLSDLVEFDGSPVTVQDRLRYVLLNKPPGTVCTASDPQGRPLALDIVQPHFAERLHSVGRLDQYSSGLILFTNDGEFTRRWGHPSSGLEKEYLVESYSDIPDELFQAFTSGIVVEGVRYRAKSAARTGPRQARIVLVEGKNREIRVVFGDFACQIRSLCRIRIGNLTAEGLLQGAWRELDREEALSFGLRAGEGHMKGAG